MSFLVDIAAAPAQVGGKARSLAELAARGLRTPRGFVVTDAVFRELCGDAVLPDRLDQAALLSLDALRARLLQAPWPDGFRDELAGRLRALMAETLAVRSSFASEDVTGALAAGVYESRTAVPLAEVETAIRQVLCSALSPGAVAYALAHGQAPASAPVAVLVHAFMAGAAEGSAAFAPGPMSAPLIETRRGQLPKPAAAELGAQLTELAQARGPTEIEWVYDDAHLVYLQARPFEPPISKGEWSGWQDLEAAAGPRQAWHWDAAHNPLPLSSAQVGLVELVDAASVTGIRQRVLGGYLFYASDSRSLPNAIACEEAAAYFASLRSRVEARLSELGPSPSLEDALALFLSTYEPIFSVLQPALRESHRRLRAFLEAHAAAGVALIPDLRTGVPSVASERLQRMAAIHSAATDQARRQACSDYLARFGDEAATWDVCAPTYAENPSALQSGGAGPHGASASRWERASSAVEAMLAPSLHLQWRGLLALSREACALGEADDWLYARAQAAIRRALLAVGNRLREEGRLVDAADVFFLPFVLVRAIAGGGVAPVDLGTRATAGRLAWQMACVDQPFLSEGEPGHAIHGVGTGGRAIGRVFHHRPDRASPADAVLVAKSLLPTELPLVCAIAIVTETGGPLGHVAAQARERGIPALVGAAGAGTAFADGDLVLVDADRGLVVALG